MWTRTENYFPVATMFIWSNDPSVFNWGGVVSNKKKTKTVLFCGQSSSWLGLCLFSRWSGLTSQILSLPPTSVEAIRSQMANGGSPKYIFALESHLKGCTPPARLGMQGCAEASLVGKQRKGLDFQKYSAFLDFFSPWKKDFVLEQDQIYVASTMQKKWYDTEIFNYPFIST